MGQCSVECKSVCVCESGQSLSIEESEGLGEETITQSGCESLNALVLFFCTLLVALVSPSATLKALCLDKILIMYITLDENIR